MLRNAYVRAANDFVHDIAAGVFPGAVLAAYLIRTRIEADAPGALFDVTRAMASLWQVLLGSLLAILVTGVLRQSYWRLNTRAGYLETRKRTALAKHAAFVALLVGCFVVMLTLQP